MTAVFSDTNSNAHPDADPEADSELTQPPDEAAQALLERLERFLSQAESADFDALTRAVFAFQFARIEPFRRLCQSRGRLPDSLSDWRDIPPVPVAAFKSLQLAAAPAREIFRSSGTTQGARRSVHHHPFPQLYRRTIELGFSRHCLRQGEQQIPFLSLVAPRSQIADSSLGFMAEHLITRFAQPPSGSAFNSDGVDFRAADAWARGILGSATPGLIFSTAFALAWWLEDLEARGAQHALPVGSRIFETGGFKGKTRQLSRDALLRRVARRLGVPATHVVREYGMSELTGHFYSAVLEGGDADLFVIPHFMRIRALDPESLQSVPDGQPGLLAILDLANIGSAMHVLTEDLGIIEPGGFRLIGRASGAELRGCSLTVEELRA